MQGKSSFKRKLPNIILAIFFIIGLCIFLYPSVSDFLSEWKQSQEINKYESKASELSLETYEKLISDAEEYNSSLVRT
jgi:sortase A